MVDFVDRIVDSLDKLLLMTHNAVFQSNPREFIDLVGTDDDTTFVGKDGSLLTVFRIRGMTSTLDNEQTEAGIYEMAEILGRDLIKNGAHWLSISFEFDPDAAKNYAARSLAGTRQTARHLGFGDLADAIFEEKTDRMAEYCQVEQCYMVIATTPQAIDKRDMGDERKKRAENMRSWPLTAESMLNDMAYPQLRTKHDAAVREVLERLKSLKNLDNAGMLMQVMSVRAYLRQCKQVTTPGTSNRWEPRISADAGQDVRLPETPKDLKGVTEDFKMPPPIGEQLISETPSTIGTKYVVLGNRIYYPVSLSLGPSDPKTFDELINSASGMRLPFRINITIKANGLGYDYLNTVMGKTFSWTSNGNNQIKRANDALEQYVNKNGGMVAAMFINACTWARAIPEGKPGGDIEYDLSEIEARGTKLHRALQSWGGCQTTDAFNAPIEGTLACQPGLCDKPMGRVLAPPMPDAVGMTPVFRQTTSWDAAEGNLLMRSENGRFLHYHQTSSKQSAWVTLLVGPMGFSKSTTMNTLNLYYLFTPSSEGELPFLRSLDVGPSSRAIVDAVQGSVSSEYQHIARYIRLQNTSDYQLNPFDTPLGLEYPLASHKDYLRNFVSAVCYTMSQDEKISGRLPGLVTKVIDTTYEMYANNSTRSEARPRRFSRNANSLITEKVDEHGIEVDEHSTFHEVRDALMRCGEIRAAHLAHLRAMPILRDLIAAANTNEIQDMYGDVIDGVKLLDLFQRSITEAEQMFELLQGHTQFELGEAKVISLDLEDMVPKDKSPRSLWQASIAFLLGYNVLTKDFFFHESDLASVPQLYYRYHERRVNHLATARKRFSMDERQRFSAVTAAQSQVDSLIAEGRKNLVDIMVASQLFQDHTEKSVELATSVFILGAGNLSSQDSENVKERFQLNDAQMKTIRSIRRPGKPGAEAFVIFRTGDGEQRHHVRLTEGPIYLWLIATEAADREIRRRLYQRYPRGEALQRLAAAFPGGSVKQDMEAKLAEMNDEEDEIDGRANDSILDEFIARCDAVTL